MSYGGAGSAADGPRVMRQNKAILGKRASLQDISTAYGNTVLGDNTKFKVLEYSTEQIEQAKKKIKIQNKKNRIRKFIFYSVSLLISLLILFGLFWN